MRAGLSFSYSPISLLLRQPLSIKKSYAGAIQFRLGSRHILALPTRSICAVEKKFFVFHNKIFLKKVELCLDLLSMRCEFQRFWLKKREFGTCGLNTYKTSATFYFAIYRAGMKLGESKFITSVIRSKRSQHSEDVFCIKSETINSKNA
jgi:hypothetical protein